VTLDRQLIELWIINRVSSQIAGEAKLKVLIETEVDFFQRLTILLSKNPRAKQEIENGSTTSSKVNETQEWKPSSA
jgi:hypothetical protein